MWLFAKIAEAQVTASNIKGNPALVSIMSKIINAIVVPLVSGLFVLAVLIFVWGIFRFVIGSGDPTARKQGQEHMLWGVIGMAIMVSVYGIIRVIANTIPGSIDPFQ